MASSRRPRMSLPPELGAIDDGWGEEEQPTIARPSRLPTAPVRAKIPITPSTGEAPVPDFAAHPRYAPDLALEGESIQERVTTVPEIPPEEYARRMMQSDPGRATLLSRQGAQTRPSDPSRRTEPTRNHAAQHAVTEPPPEGAGYGDRSLSPAPSELKTDPDWLTLDPLTAGTGSDVPTAPPPAGFHPPSVTNLPPVSKPGVSLADATSPSAHRSPPLSHPRQQPVTPGKVRPTPSASTPEQAMKDKFAMGDFSGALEIAESILAKSPSNADARSLSKKCREVLQDMYASRIADMERVPSIVMSPDQIRWLSLDHRAGFLLSMVDGMSSVDDLLDVSGMQRLDALRILCGLLDQKVIALD